MELNLVVPGESASAGKIQVSETAFGREFNEALVHQVVTAYMAASRAGTKATLSRAEVRGGGRKPFKQKGSGRARAGSIRSPIWRGGGHGLPLGPRDFTQKVNKKMYRGAIQSILSELIRQERLVVVENFSVATPKTKDLLVKLNSFGLKDVLIVSDSVDENLYLSARNLHKVDVRDVTGVDPVSLIAFDKVLITVGALKQFEEQLA